MPIATEHDDRIEGIYRKYKVERTDGGSAPGEKHEKCFYFVLDLTCDPFAVPALHAYAEACKDDFPALAADLRVILSRMAAARPDPDEEDA